MPALSFHSPIAAHAQNLLLHKAHHLGGFLSDLVHECCFINDCYMHEQLVIIVGINTPQSLIMSAFPFILKVSCCPWLLSCPLSSYQYANSNLFCLVLSRQGLKWSSLCTLQLTAALTFCSSRLHLSNAWIAGVCNLSWL